MDLWGCPALERRGMRSHAGAWERDSVGLRRLFGWIPAFAGKTAQEESTAEWATAHVYLDSRLTDFGNDGTRKGNGGCPAGFPIKGLRE